MFSSLVNFLTFVQPFSPGTNLSANAERHLSSVPEIPELQGPSQTREGVGSWWERVFLQTPVRTEEEQVRTGSKRCYRYQSQFTTAIHEKTGEAESMELSNLLLHVFFIVYYSVR